MLQKIYLMILPYVLMFLKVVLPDSMHRISIYWFLVVSLSCIAKIYDYGKDEKSWKSSSAEFNQLTGLSRKQYRISWNEDQYWQIGSSKRIFSSLGRFLLRLFSPQIHSSPSSQQNLTMPSISCSMVSKSPLVRRIFFQELWFKLLVVVDSVSSPSVLLNFSSCDNVFPQIFILRWEEDGFARIENVTSRQLSYGEDRLTLKNHGLWCTRDLVSRGIPISFPCILYLKSFFITI